MTVSLAISKMIEFYNGNLSDISHFLKVWAFAKVIGEQERLPSQMQETLELAAVVHDIACPLCRRKYGNTNGKNQERESAPLGEAFFASMPAGGADTERVSWLVSHHYTYDNVDGPDHQILLEADFLVNAFEDNLPKDAIVHFRDKVFETETGLHLLNTMFGL